MKYFNDKVDTSSSYVHYKFIDANNIVIEDHPHEICFAGITYGKIPEHIKTIRIFHPFGKMPYALPEVERWIGDLNAIGFPCAVSRIADDYAIDIKPDNYKKKIHLNATVMLIRVLWERGMCVVPDEYFTLMDDNPNADKFNMIQVAHKHKGNAGTCNTNHMVTYKGNGPNVTQELLFSRFNATTPGPFDLSTQGSLPQSRQWIGLKAGQRESFPGCNDCEKDYNEALNY